jgi:vacuolar iron transporter family protein
MRINQRVNSQSKCVQFKLSNEKKPGEVPKIKEIHSHIRGRGLISSIALSLSDGLVTNLAFLTGFAGGAASLDIIRFAGITVMSAGAVSMFFGGLLAARSETELFEADAKREMSEIEQEPEEERTELKSFYLEKGLTSQEADIVVKRITSDKRKWLEDLLIHELHLHAARLENPAKIALAMGLSFLAGAFIPIIPYLLLAKPSAIIPSVVLSLVFLFGAGLWKGRISKAHVIRNGLEMLGIGAAASLILYLIGSLIGFF